MVADRWVRTCLGSVPERAERARRFCISLSAENVGAKYYRKKSQGSIRRTFGSCKSNFSQCSAVLMERVGSRAVDDISLAESGVRGVPISFFT